MSKSRTRLFLTALMLVGMAATIGACQRPTETELRTAGWTPHQVVARGTPIYCYRPYPVNAGSDRVFFICSL